MARKPSEIFTDKELEIMGVFWEWGECTARQVQEALPGERHYNSVMTIIRVLEKKGHLKHRADGRTYIYRAAASQKSSRENIASYLIRQVFGGSPASLVVNLVETGELTIDDIEEIRAQLAAGETAKKVKGKGK